MFQMWGKQRLGLRSLIMRKNNKRYWGITWQHTGKKKKKPETVLTWIVFGMSLLWPVPVESDSVLRCPTGTTVEQRFVCAVSIQRLCTDKMEHKEKVTQGVKYTEGHKTHTENTAKMEHCCFDLLPNVRQTKRLDSITIINSGGESLHGNPIQI